LIKWRTFCCKTRWPRWSSRRSMISLLPNNFCSLYFYFALMSDHYWNVRLLIKVIFRAKLLDLCLLGFKLPN
jgi:hypothetical protein